MTKLAKITLEIIEVNLSEGDGKEKLIEKEEVNEVNLTLARNFWSFAPHFFCR